MMTPTYFFYVKQGEWWIVYALIQDWHGLPENKIGPTLMSEVARFMYGVDALRFIEDKDKNDDLRHLILPKN